MAKKPRSLRIKERILRLTAQRLDRPRRIDRIIDYFGGSTSRLLVPQSVVPRRLARSGA